LKILRKKGGRATEEDQDRRKDIPPRRDPKKIDRPFRLLHISIKKKGKEIKDGEKGGAGEVNSMSDRRTRKEKKGGSPYLMARRTKLEAEGNKKKKVVLAVLQPPKRKKWLRALALNMRKRYQKRKRPVLI